jgi:hypothetical protein
MASVNVDANDWYEVDPPLFALAYIPGDPEWVPWIDVETCLWNLAYNVIDIPWWDTFTYDWTVGKPQDVNPYVPTRTYKWALAYTIDATPWVPSRYAPITPDVTPEIVDLVKLANLLKAAYNKHIALEVFREYRNNVPVKERVHMQSDFINSVTSPDATDLDSAIVLLNEIKLRYNRHREEHSVHGNVAVIRLDAPARTLYNSISVYLKSTGIPNLLASFSDDEGGTLNDV